MRRLITAIATAGVALAATLVLPVPRGVDAQPIPTLPGTSSTTTSSTPASSTTSTTRPRTTTTASPTPTLPTAPGGSSTSTSSTSSTSTTSTTSTTGPRPSPSTTAVPPTSPGPAPPPPPPPSAKPPPPTGSTEGKAPKEAGGFPSELRKLMNSIRRTPSRTTAPLIDALAPAVAIGVPAQDVWTLGFGRFPIAGAASWVHDWWFPRFGPDWRLHEGTDVFAANGTPVRSPVDGTLRLVQGGKGGIVAYVTMADRTYIYLAHLAAYAPGLVEGQPVKTGQVVGYVGTTGNAAGGSPHLHIEVHPRGGGPIDPKPVLDRWLKDAIKRAPKVVKAYEEAARKQREAAPPPPPPPPALTRIERRALEWEEARQRAKAYVLPLTPPLLAAFVAKG